MTLPSLYPILDTASLEREGCPIVAAAEAMLAGGAQILQFRHKGHFSRGVFAVAERVAGLCRQGGALFVVDDRADIAALLDAGLHLGQEDLPPVEARRIVGPSRVIGLSTHNESQLEAAAAEPVDYIAIGPVFATATKERPDPVAGVAMVSRARRRERRPLVAIGGITRQTAPEVIAAGADAVAVVGDLLPRPCTPKAIRERMEEWQRLLRQRPA